MQLTAVNICLNEPCETLNVSFRYRMVCNSITLYPYVYGLGATLQIQGYLWDFGDGNTSTEAFPNHIYSTPGSYDVILTVYTKDKETGECCKKTYKMKVKAIECEPCK